MKKKKFINVLLLAVVLGVWALVLFKLFRTPESKQLTIADVDYSSLSKKVEGEHRPPLIAFFADPFLKDIPSERKELTVTEPVILEQIIEEEPIPFVWPPIVFKGVVSASKGKERIAIIDALGQEWLLRKNDRLTSELFIQQVRKDSIHVAHTIRKEENKWIRIKY